MRVKQIHKSSIHQRPHFCGSFATKPDITSLNGNRPAAANLNPAIPFAPHVVICAAIHNSVPLFQGETVSPIVAGNDQNHIAMLQHNALRAAFWARLESILLHCLSAGYRLSCAS
jgi:hypothetical protein